VVLHPSIASHQTATAKSFVLFTGAPHAQYSQKHSTPEFGGPGGGVGPPGIDTRCMLAKTPQPAPVVLVCNATAAV
jgi:hypothetical protein